MASDSKARNDVIVEFLEVAFNCILYHRKVYPSSIFTPKKKYSVPVFLAAHPRVVKYITECLKTIRTLLEGNDLHHIELVIFSNSQQVEKHVFQIVSTNLLKDEMYIGTEEAFRAYLLKLSGSTLNSVKLSEDCNFSIELTMTEQASVRLSDSVMQSHFPWLEAEESTNTKPTLIPLKTVKTENVGLEMFMVVL